MSDDERMRQLPSGNVTFLFTDIEGSTRLVQERGERYADDLAEHRLVLRKVFERHGGVEVDTQGDAFSPPSRVPPMPPPRKPNAPSRSPFEWGSTPASRRSRA